MINKIIKDAENKAKNSMARQMNDLGLGGEDDKNKKKEKEESMEEPIEDATFSLLKSVFNKLGNLFFKRLPKRSSNLTRADN